MRRRPARFSLLLALFAAIPATAWASGGEHGLSYDVWLILAGMILAAKVGGEVAVRKLAIVVQLSDPDDYQGGELEVFNIVHEYEPDDVIAWSDDARQQGSVIVFPAFEYHRVTPIVDGERYSLVCWIGGPPFR